MPIIRTLHNKENPYVQINKKALWDSDLSFEAKGLWAQLLSRPNNWTVSVSELCKACKCSDKPIYRIFKELIEKGYAHRRQLNVKGKFQSFEMYVFEFKVTPEEIKEMFADIKEILPLPPNPGSGYGYTNKTNTTKTPPPSSFRSSSSGHFVCEESSLHSDRVAPQGAPGASPGVSAAEESSLRSKGKEKGSYGEHGFVRLSLEEYAKAIAKYGAKAVEEEIESLDLWLGRGKAKGERNHYLTLLTFLRKRPQDACHEMVEEKNRALARYVKDFLGEAGKGIRFFKDAMYSAERGDSLKLNLPNETFKEILFKWYEIKETT
jgi:hypothetical protein